MCESLHVAVNAVMYLKTKYSFLADRTQYYRLLASSCRPSQTVCPSVCAFWLSGSVYKAESCTSVFLAGKFPFCPFRHFCCRLYRLATKHNEKERVEENANVRFFETDNQACTGRVTFTDLVKWTLASHAEVDWVWVRRKTLPLGPLNRIFRTSHLSTCNRNRFDSFASRP